MFRLDIEEQGRIRTVDLAEGRYLLGRADHADVRFESYEVSREHAALVVENDRIWVEDLGSLWGTWLGSHRLNLGDRCPFTERDLLRLAQVQLWTHGAPRPALPDDSAPGPDWSDTGVSRIPDGPDSGRRALRMVRHLFEMLQATEDGQAIEQEACLFVKNWVRADRVCLFEADQPGTAPTIRGWWSRLPLEPGQLLISERVVREVLDSNQPVVWCRDGQFEDLSSTDSRHRFGIHAAAAVPVNAPPAIRAILYVDRRQDGGGYGEEDLEILTATASAVAMRRSVSVSRIETAKAIRIQRQMLPDAIPQPPGYELDAGLRMCHGVGGDLYDFICRPDERCLFVVGDVSGKGLAAALLMGATAFLVHTLAELQLSPLEIYQRVHRSLLEKTRPGEFVALFLGELDRKRGTLRCVVAGVPFPLVIRANGDVEKLEPTAYAAALMDLDPRPATEVEIALDPDDLLAVYTDGYPEATPDGEQFLEDEVADRLVRYRHLPLPEIRARLDRTVDDFVGLAGPSDDRTLLLLRRGA